MYADGMRQRLRQEYVKRMMSHSNFGQMNGSLDATNYVDASSVRRAVELRELNLLFPIGFNLHRLLYNLPPLTLGSYFCYFLLLYLEEEGI